ncbi:MAG: energy transducer TonB [Janthinobacterium lividum]
MKTALFLLLTVLGTEQCFAQTACDSLYKLAHPLAGNRFVTKTWFEKAPEIIVGKAQLLTYHVPADRVGDAYFRVLVDERGAPRCVQWLKVANALVQAEAAKIVSSLRFSPGLQQGRPVAVP